MASEMPQRLAAPKAVLDRVAFSTILAIGLVLRLTAAWIVVFQYPRNWLFGKAPDFALLGESLNAGRGLSSPFGGSTGPTAFLAPGYPAVLGLIFHLFGNQSVASAAALIMLQIVFGLLTVAAIMFAGRWLFGAATAYLAGVFWAVSPATIWLPVIPWETCLSTLLLVSMVLLALHTVDHPGKDAWAFSGAFLGTAALVNPSLLPALLAMAGWAAWQSRRCLQRRDLLLPLLLFLVIYLPWPIRNARALHALIPLRSNFGYELWQGNRPGGDGFFDPKQFPIENRREYADYAARGEVRYMRGKTALALAFIHAHPSRFLRLCLKRTAYFWIGFEPFAGRGLLQAQAVLTSLLGLGGLAILWKQHRALAVLFLMPLLLFPLPYYVTHPDFRFRIVLDPLLTLLGAYLVTAYWNRLTSGAPGRLLPVKPMRMLPAPLRFN